jgi:lysyl endopeptidase
VYVINRLGDGSGGLGAADYSYYFGNPGDKAFVGDFDGDRVDTIGLHRETTGLVYFRNSNTQGNAEFEFFYGDPGDRLVAADWSGDGVDTVGIHRPGTSRFYFRFTNTQGNADAELGWGEPTWPPVAGHLHPG